MRNVWRNYMNYKEILKKYWFVGIIAVAMLVFIVLYSATAYKNRDIVVKNKQEDGKYIAYSVDDVNVSADDLYQTLYQEKGLSYSFTAYERAILDKAYETSSEMRENAANYASYYLSNYGESYMLSMLKQMGYVNGLDDLNQSFIDSFKQDLLIEDYAKDHYDEYVKPYVGEDGRLIYHILVKCDTEAITDENGNVTRYEAKPTEEQQNKLDEILKSLAEEDAIFESIAYSNSDDSGTATNGGYVGIINSDNMLQYDQIFAQTAMNLKDGEISDTIVSQFGYHIIKNAGSSSETLLNDYYFMNDLINNNSVLSLNAVIDKGEELGFEIKSEELLEEINSLRKSEE